jgi:replication factor A1
MDVDYHLSAGACAQITQAPLEDEEAWNMQPTVQFLSIKKLPNPKPEETPDRYRLIISDGVHFVQAMLATQLNELVDNNTVTKHSVVTLEKYTSNVVQNKRYALYECSLGST